MRKPIKIGLFSAILALVLDQASKFWLVSLLQPEHKEIALLPFFKLVMWWNKGISFGMFAQHETSAKWVLIAIALAILAFLFRWLLQAENQLVGLGIGLVMGGAIGNVIDRLHWGAVADFFYFYYKDWYWPAFNVADSTIFIGVVLLCWDGFKHKSGAEQ